MTHIIRATILLFLTLATTKHALFCMGRTTNPAPRPTTSIQHYDPVVSSLKNINLRPETRKSLEITLRAVNSASILPPELNILTHEFTGIGEGVQRWFAILSPAEFTQLLVENKILPETKQFLSGTVTIRAQNLTIKELYNAISGLQGTHFDTLYLTGNHLGTLSAKDLHFILSALKGTSISCLLLWNNKLATLGAEGLHHALSALEGTSISCLNLWNNSLETLGAEGLRHALSALEGTGVESLKLWNNSLETPGTNGLRHTLSAPKNTRVTSIVLGEK